MSNEIEEIDDPGIVEIMWVDSLIINNGEWTDIDELLDDLKEESMLHRTTGYLVGESDVAIAIALSLNAQPDSQARRVSGGMVIPKSAIKETLVLREKK